MTVEEYTKQDIVLRLTAKVKHRNLSAGIFLFRILCRYECYSS